MLEPCAVKVASTVLRRGLHREMGFLSDKEPVAAQQNIILDEDAEDEPAINEIGLLEKIYPEDANKKG